jgi:hypothetical protein
MFVKSIPCRKAPVRAHQEPSVALVPVATTRENSLGRVIEGGARDVSRLESSHRITNISRWETSQYVFLNQFDKVLGRQIGPLGRKKNWMKGVGETDWT